MAQLPGDAAVAIECDDDGAGEISCRVLRQMSGLLTAALPGLVRPERIRGPMALDGLSSIAIFETLPDSVERRS